MLRGKRYKHDVAWSANSKRLVNIFHSGILSNGRFWYPALVSAAVRGEGKMGQIDRGNVRLTKYLQLLLGLILRACLPQLNGGVTVDGQCRVPQAAKASLPSSQKAAGALVSKQDGKEWRDGEMERCKGFEVRPQHTQFTFRSALRLPRVSRSSFKLLPPKSQLAIR
jgi:hypothetical protein